MTVSLLHLFHSAQPDDPDATLIRPSNWNAQHTLTGTPGMVLGFDGSGNAVDVVPSSGSPAAPNHSVQFNNSGAFGGDANLTWTPGTGLTDKLNAIFGNSATFGGFDSFIGSSTPGYTGFHSSTLSPLIAQTYYNADLSTIDIVAGLATHITVQHSGIADAIADGGTFSLTTNPESTGPFSFQTALNAFNSYAGAGACPAIYGAFVTCAFSPPGTRTDSMYAIGTYTIGETQNVCNGTLVYGLWAEAHLSAPNSTANLLVAVYGQPTLDASTCFATNIYGLYAACPTYAGVGIQATNAYGLYLENQNQVGGSGGGSTNNWNLYSVGGNSQNTFEGKINIGLVGSNTGNIHFIGKTSGAVTLSTQDAAGTWTMKLPTTAGTNAYVLQTDGSGNTSWVPQSGGGAVSSVTGSGAISVSPTTGATVVSVATATSSVLGVVKPDNTTITISGGTISAVGSAATIVVNSSPITAGTTGHVAYDNAGTFGEAANFLISSGNPNVTLTHAYLYNNQNAIFAVPPSGAFTTLPNSWFFGDAGNFTVSGDSNFCEGPGAGASLTTGHWNMVEGTEGLNSGTTATSNLVFGRRAAFSLIDGTDNVWAGTGAGQNATTGCSFNVAIGTGAMGSGALVGAVSNVAIGNVALSNLAGASGRNVAIGTGSAQTATAMNSGIMVGMNAGQAITAANNNILIGDTAAAVLSTGGYNICIGHLAASKLTGGFNTLIGAVVANTTLTSGSQNIIIGTQCDVPSASASGQISIGNQIYGTNCTSTGATVGTGQIGIGISGPTAFLHVAAATTAQSAISLTPSAGVSPSSPNNGDLWNDGTHLYFRHGGVSTDLLAGGGGGVTSGTMTANAAVYATGAGSIASTAALTNGQILIGSTGVAPVAATIATSGSGISVTNGAGTITLANTGVTSAVAGTGISVSGATGAVTIGLVTPVTVANGGSGAATFAAHGLLLGEGASAFGVTAVGTTNQILIGQSAADPIWATTLPTAALPAFTGDVTSPAASTVNTLASIITAGGPTGSATTVPIITWDAKGRLTVVSSAAIAIAAGSVSGLAAVATSGSATDLTTGTLPSGRFGPLTGDVTTSGYVATLANIPTGTPAVGTILHTNIAAPSAPAAGKIAVYTNTTNNILSAMNSGGTVSNTVVADTGAANNFLTAISAGGVISKAQPSFSNLSGSLASTQTPAYTGDVTSSAGATVNTLASIITAGGPTGNATTVPVITYDAKGRLTAVTTATIAAGTANVDPSPQRVVAVNAGSTTMTGWNLILDPAGLLTTYAITMPASPSNGQIAVIRSSQPISGLSFTAPGTTLVAAPNTLAAGSRLEAIYISAVTSWYFGL